MRKKDDIDRVWDIIEKVSLCMLTTTFAGGLRARPLEARPDRYAGHIYFVTDIHSAKEYEIEATPDVGLVFIDSNDKAYLSITGRACVMLDADKIKAAWRKTDAVWWPGARTIPTYAYCGSSLTPRNCGMDRQALPLLPSSSSRRG
jgi:general stress protein 26